MKSTLWTVFSLILLIAFNDFLLASPRGRILFSFVDWPTQKAAASTVATALEEPARLALAKTQLAAPKTQSVPKKTADASSHLKAHSLQPTPTASPPQPAPQVKAASAPAVPSAEQVTQNWSAIPQGFFNQPRHVSLCRDSEIVMRTQSGRAKVRMPKRAKLQVVAQDGMALVVAPSPNSPLRGEVEMDATDFKEVFTAAYDEVIQRKAEVANKEPLADLKASPSLQATEIKTDVLGAPPSKADDGTYPLLVSSMKSGEVTEIKPEHVKYWGEPVRSKVEGKEYWIVKVKFDSLTQFGKFETEAYARVLQGKVDGWSYAGSGEPVP